MSKFLLFIGPFPPPTNGQSVVTHMLADKLSNEGLNITRVDINSHTVMIKLAKHIRSAFLILAGYSPCYISVNSNSGIWLTSLLAAMARIRRRSVFLHHHSYSHIRSKDFSMRVLSILAGKRAVHIVLGNVMGQELMRNTPTVKRVFTLNNAGFLDVGNVGSNYNVKDNNLTIGHLSNLTEDKGIGIVIETFRSLLSQGSNVKLRIAGPTTDFYAEAAIKRASVEFGPSFTYLGPVYGSQKLDFFNSIDVFLFPSRYRNEAEPIVILESLANGVPVIAYAVGCIKDDISNGGATFHTSADFAASAKEVIGKMDIVEMKNSATAQFNRLHEQHLEQISDLTATMLK